MKRKAVSVLLGGAMVMAVCGSSAQARTYGYDIGEGKTIYVIESGDDAEQSLEEQKRLSDWHVAEMEDQIAYLEKYGVTYNADEDVLYYEGKTVRWLIDEQMGNTYKAFQMPEGEIDVYTTRGEDYKLTGVRVATQGEYEERTREDETAKLEMEAAEDGSVIHTFTCDTGAEYIEGEYSSQETVVITEDAVSGTDIAEKTCEDYAVEGDYEESEKKIKEYKENGIDYDSKNGCWMWQGKMVYYLMDENGSTCQNGAKEAKENKIYILVKRNMDGSVKEVKQITAEEVMKERILRDEKND